MTNIAEELHGLSYEDAVEFLMNKWIEEKPEGYSLVSDYLEDHLKGLFPDCSVYRRYGGIQK